MPKDYSEDQLIQRSAAELLEKELGWTSVYAFDKEVLGANGTLGRNSYHEVLLTGRFCKALKALNPWLTDKQLQECVERMTEHMSSQTLMQINEQKYQYIKDGVPVTRIKPNGETEEVRAKVIDFASPQKNDFLCVREMWVYGALYHRRADIIGFFHSNFRSSGIRNLNIICRLWQSSSRSVIDFLMTTSPDSTLDKSRISLIRLVRRWLLLSII